MKYLLTTFSLLLVFFLSSGGVALADPPNAGEHKVCICHNSHSQAHPLETISVDEHAVCTHLTQHEDSLGPCPGDNVEACNGAQVLEEFECGNEGDDNCEQDPDKTQPGLCGCGVSDQDSDGDNTPDCNDQCPNAPDKTEPGTCGCEAADEDFDGDGTVNCEDACPEDADKTEPGLCGCGIAEDCSDLPDSPPDTPPEDIPSEIPTESGNGPDDNSEVGGGNPLNPPAAGLQNYLEGSGACSLRLAQGATSETAAILLLLALPLFVLRRRSRARARNGGI